MNAVAMIGRCMQRQDPTIPLHFDVRASVGAADSQIHAPGETLPDPPVTETVAVESPAVWW